MQGISLDPVPFSEWFRESQGSIGEVTLSPSCTVFFPDGWERYSGMLREAGVPESPRHGPVMELYVAGHNTVYEYNLAADKLDAMIALSEGK